MTKGEVDSLNDLAMAHGGQLTINPHTGLPEAGFLSGLLPMMLGAGLAAATGGSSLLIGAGIGGLQAARTGSIGKGLMAGLGAFGGAGLASGLAAAGNAAASQAASAANPAFMGPMPGAASGLSAVQAGATGLTSEAGRSAALSAMGGGAGAAKLGLMAATPAIVGETKTPTMATPDKDMGQRYSFTGNQPQVTPAPDVPTYDDMLTKQGNFGGQQNYFATPTYTPINPTQAKDLYHFADGGPVEQMSNQASLGLNTMYPMANMSTSSFATPYQSPVSTNMLAPTSDVGVGMGGEPNMQGTRLAEGGISDAGYNLGGYSDGGRLLRGPGDGVSDSIPATIGHKQPARLADGEFVVPARIVSELGNGSTEAGARKLYAMMDRVQAARKKTVGKNKVAHNSRADKYLPA
ncbi:hypothetical protein EBT31_02190 [bacterium]|nr:hypothetical protein [bacterium]NBX48488.1 hypothetical protein [bacterium]